MQYQVSPNIISNNIFFVNFSEVQGRRLDPAYVSSMKNKNTYKCATKSLGKLVSFVTGGTPSKEKPEYWNGKLYWVSAKDFKSFYLDSSEDTITELGLKNSSSKLIPENSLLMVVRSGILRHTLPIAINTCPVTINQDIKALFVKDDNLNVHYLGYFFEVFNKYVLPKIVKHSTTVQSVNTNELESIEIPIPSMEIQKKIIELMDLSYAQKRQKEQQAEHLLQRIDDFILDELSIKLPHMKSQTLQDRMYIVNKSVLDGRLDPYYSQEYFRNAFEVLESCKYPVVNLKEISKLITSGITPKSGGDAYTEDKSIGVPFVRSGNISIDGELNYDDLLYLKPEIHENVMSSSKLKKDDILIAIVGATIGQVGIYLSEGEANINQAIALVRLKEGYNVQFIKELIKSSVGQLSLNRLKRPVARANINLEEVSRIKVVLPPEEKQQEIVNHITAIRQQAKALREEGKAILEQAKMEVESMIMYGKKN